ncbi:uncharacterized protein LOC123312875 [Coccinella septempunctata]|uniref:uncharacterized protein LOC123312875 n=1 Tax=Coccinella septempunctata TaxID=41139 RepID=UPI001D08ACBD|nr:uncharacterized protein LOC123312875 [Coccinella septempunctata]
MAVTELKCKVETMGQTETIEPDEDIWGEFNLPLISNEKLSEFEIFLKVEDNMKKSVKQLSKVGGDTPYEFCRRALATLLSNKLASEYSWIGLKKKLVFSKTLVADLIMRSAQLNGKTRDSPLKEIEDAIKKFRGGPRRDLWQRKERAKFNIFFLF